MMRRWQRAGCGLAFLVLLSSCARSPAATEASAPVAASASLAVDVYGGLDESAALAAAPAAERVELLVDSTLSMAPPARADRARSAAAQILRGLPDDGVVSLRSVGHRDAGDCTGSERLLTEVRASDRERVSQRLAALAARSEASLAQALDEVAADLASEASARSTRVVLISDLDDACSGDLCAAAQRLVARGAWLEVVPTGALAPPACLAELLPSPALPPSAAALGTPPAEFTVTAQEGAAEAARVVATGRAGEGSILLPPGVVTVTLHLDPPERIGPFRLDPGDSARVRVLETYDAAAPTRIWRIERGDEAVGRAFPPPDELGTGSP